MKLIALPLIVLTLCSCSTFDGNKVSLPRNNQTAPALRTPPGTSIAFDTLYPIPERNYPTSTKPVDITPPELYTSKS